MTMSTRKFFRTVFTVEVLSEEPLPDGMTLEAIGEEITTGPSSGDITCLDGSVEIDGAKAAELLLRHGSDPGFFQLTEDGEDSQDP